MTQEIRIYSDKKSKRLVYVVQFIFEDLLGITPKFVTDIQDVHLVYGLEHPTAICCKNWGLLEQKNIEVQAISWEKWGETACFFRTQTDSAQLPFDIFSASFYLIVRYEEYLPYQKDAHQRFQATDSILHSGGQLQQPLVNQWALRLKDILQQKFPTLVFQPRKFSFVSSIDVDQAWKYKNKGWKRNILGFLRDASERNWERCRQRIAVLSNKIADPFDTFEWQNDIHKAQNTKVNYFILLGDYAIFDKNISHKNAHFQKLITDLASNNHYTLGIHPSYQSNSDVSRVSIEKKRLENIIQKPISTSRQHYLMHTFPETYRELMAQGIEEDYTMGYSTHLGFRAGVAAPFYFFDLVENEPTNLRLFPFCAMDITPLHYLKMSPDEATIELKKLIDNVVAVGGLYMPLWHNESLSEDERWKEWRQVYEWQLKYAASCLS